VDELHLRGRVEAFHVGGACRPRRLRLRLGEVDEVHEQLQLGHQTAPLDLAARRLLVRHARALAVRALRARRLSAQVAREQAARSAGQTLAPAGSSALPPAVHVELTAFPPSDIMGHATYGEVPVHSRTELGARLSGPNVEHDRLD
jgi:hypothetical protein